MMAGWWVQLLLIVCAEETVREEAVCGKWVLKVGPFSGSSSQWVPVVGPCSRSPLQYMRHACPPVDPSSILHALHLLPPTPVSWSPLYLSFYYIL